MHEAVMKLESYQHDFIKKLKNEEVIIRDDLIDMLLDGKPDDLIRDRVAYLRKNLKGQTDLEQFPKLNVIYEDMPEGVLMMAYGANGTFSVLRSDGTVRAGKAVVETPKGHDPCSPPTSSSTSRRERASKKSKPPRAK